MGAQQQFSASRCARNNKAGSCSVLIYRIINPDQTQTDIGWTSNTAPTASSVASPPTGGAVNPYAQDTMRWVGGWEKGVAYTQDSNGNTIFTLEDGWFDNRNGSPPTTMISAIPGTPVREITTPYNTATSTPEYWNHTAPAYLRALQSASVGNGTTTVATTSYGYDTAFTTANLLSQSWSNSIPNQSVSKSWSYVMPDGKVNGNLVAATDPNHPAQNVTHIVYDANDLYPIEIDEAYQLPEQRTTKPAYDFNSGLLSSSTDDNSVNLIYTYDNIGRQTKVEEKGNGSLDRTTTTLFDDTGLSVKTTQNQTGITSTAYYDPVGRVRLTIDGDGNKVQHAYRAGTGGVSYELASAPYSSSVPIAGWTLITLHVTNATTTVQTFQGSDPPGGLTFAGGTSAPPQWGSNTNSTGQTVTTMNDPNTATCSGPTTDVQDQASNTTKYCADALGRLVGVTDGSGNLTQHSYDLLDDLTQVVQNGQTRSFVRVQFARPVDQGMQSRDGYGQLYHVPVASHRAGVVYL